MCSPDIFLGLIAILFPPIAVWVKCGICSANSLINICLCILGGIPGLLHAWYIIAKYPENDYEALADAETGRVAYVIIQGPNGSRRMVRPSSEHNVGYGTTAPMAPQVHQGINGMWSNSGAGPVTGSSNAGLPPTYAESVRRDHKIQSQD